MTSGSARVFGLLVDIQHELELQTVMSWDGGGVVEYRTVAVIVDARAEFHDIGETTDGQRRGFLQHRGERRRNT